VTFCEAVCWRAHAVADSKTTKTINSDTTIFLGFRMVIHAPFLERIDAVEEQ